MDSQRDEEDKGKSADWKFAWHGNRRFGGREGEKKERRVQSLLESRIVLYIISPRLKDGKMHGMARNVIPSLTFLLNFNLQFLTKKSPCQRLQESHSKDFRTGQTGLKESHANEHLMSIFLNMTTIFYAFEIYCTSPPSHHQRRVLYESYQNQTSQNLQQRTKTGREGEDGKKWGWKQGD